MKLPEKTTKYNADDAVVKLTWLVIMAVPALIFVVSVIRAFVIRQLWSWYIVPGFGAHELILPIAFGVSLLFGYLTPDSHCKDERSLGERIGYLFGVPVVTLILGWLGTLFM